MHTAIGASRMVCAVVLLSWAVNAATAADAEHAYPNRAAVAEYGIAKSSDEIDLARSAAPASISGNATVLTLGSRGYETAVNGKNGFTCLVMRSWGADFSDAEFWNPKLRGPICLNPAAVRSELPGYLEKTNWVLAGVSKADMIARTQSALAAKISSPPPPGAMGFMMSKQGFLSDAGGHWHPHLMIYLPRTDDAAWGANLKGSPIIGAQSSVEPVTVFIVPVTQWSDGTSAMVEKH